MSWREQGIVMAAGLFAVAAIIIGVGAWNIWGTHTRSFAEGFVLAVGAGVPLFCAGFVIGAMTFDGKEHR